MKIIPLFTASMLLAGVATLPAQAEMRPSTEDFIQKTATGNRFEIDSSRLAVDKAHSPKIRDFARQMISDHRKAGEDFTDTLTKDRKDKDKPVPNDEPNADQKKALDALNNAPEKEFDKTYVDTQVKAHDDTVSLFEDYAKNGDDQALKDFAQRTLPTLKNHQKMVKDLQSSM
jgi:putative membrane protein